MVQKTTIVDRVAREFAKQMTHALESSKEKFNHLYSDENLKNESKFRTIVKRLEKVSPVKGSGNYEDLPMTRGFSNDVEQLIKRQNDAAATRKSRRSARPASRATG